MRSRHILAALLILLAARSTDAQLADESAGMQQHSEAVELARGGHYEESLAILARLRLEFPSDSSIAHDHVATLGWAGHDEQALAAASGIDMSSAPLYVLLAVAKAARNLSQFTVAESWYRAAMEVGVDQSDASLGLALTLADQGRHDEAIASLNDLPEDVRESSQTLHVLAVLQMQSGRLLDSLRSYDRLLDRSPTDEAALRGKALVLRELLLPKQALQLADRFPGILSDEEIERLRVDELAVNLRLASSTIYPVDIDGRLLDRTIADIGEFLVEASNPDAAIALRYDRIAALAERGNAADAIEAFEELPTPIEQMPAYVLGAAGRAYLQLQRPMDAVNVLILAAAQNPADIELQFALIYAYLDLDRYADAMSIAEAVIANEPMALTAIDSPIVKGNENRLRAEVVLAIADASINQLEDAQRRLELLLDEAPGNADLRHELANIYRWRGWLDRSLFEYDQVLTVNEDLLYARVGHTYAQLDAQRFRAVESAISSLNRQQSQEPIVVELNRDWYLHNRSELLVEATTGRSSGPTFGTDQFRIDARWFTKPIRYNYRGFVHLQNASAEFPEGSADRRRVGLGTEYRLERWTATGELLADRDNQSDLGFTGSFNWRMSDLWNLSGGLEIDSSEFQLRAYRAGLEADQIALSANYAPSESASVRVGTRLLKVSDGNRGSLLYATARRRLLTRPKSLLDVTGEISTSDYGRQDVPYFAPSRDFTYLIGAQHDWRIRRRYDRVLSQSAHLQLGRYDQQHYSGGRIWRATYTINMELSSRLLLSLGAQRSRMLYDGIVEYDTSLLATIQARL